jgi:hypothetical protein
MNIRAEDPDEVENVAAVERHMIELMRVRTVVAGAVMPDACSAGSVPGTIPVGGVETPFIRECTRPTSAARWQSRCSMMSIRLPCSMPA